MVSPFMSTPMAIMASKGAVEGVLDLPAPAPEELALRDCRVRSVEELEAPRRSPAERSEEEPFCGWVEDWICEAE
jgi:hypothetical protein